MGKRAVFWAASIIFCLYAAVEFPGTASASEESISEDYRINVGDILDVQVWREEALSRTVKVRRDGRISLSLAGDVQAAGRTPMELAEEITEKLSQYIETPEVTVIVDEQGASFYLVGEVRGTGLYPLTKEISLLQALSMGGGFTEWAEKDNILILRRNDGQEQRIAVDYNKIVDGKNPEDNIIIQPGDTIVVK